MIVLIVTLTLCCSSMTRLGEISPFMKKFQAYANKVCVIWVIFVKLLLHNLF
jgi:hypothetical protein